MYCICYLEYLVRSCCRAVMFLSTVASTLAADSWAVSMSRQMLAVNTAKSTHWFTSLRVMFLETVDCKMVCKLQMIKLTKHVWIH